MEYVRTPNSTRYPLTVLKKSAALAKNYSYYSNKFNKIKWLESIKTDLHSQNNWIIFVENIEAMKDFQLLIYSTPTEEIKVDVVLKNENIWATQKEMANLFGVQVPDISKHIKDIFESEELKADATVSKMETVVQRGFGGL